MVTWIVFPASAFTALYGEIGALSLVRNFLIGVQNRRIEIIIMQLVLLVLAMFFESTGIILKPTLMFFTIVTSLGFDPLGLAILFVMRVELSF